MTLTMRLERCCVRRATALLLGLMMISSARKLNIVQLVDGRRDDLNLSDHLKLINDYVPKFMNSTLVVSVVVREPFVIYNEPTSDGRWNETAQSELDNYSGVAIEVVKRLRSIFGLRIEVKRPRDNQFGVYSSELKAWTGLLGDLTRGEADLGVTALSITMSRAGVIDFTRAYYVETGAILLRRPEEVDNYLAIFQPFSLGLWLVLLGTILALIILLTIMTKLEDSQAAQEKRVRQMELFSLAGEQAINHGATAAPRPRHPKRPSAKGAPAEHPFGLTWLQRFYYALSCVINILLIRDIKQPPRQTPIRILVCVWWLATIVIVNVYLGILFGQLVVPQRPSSIDSLEELVGQRRIGWAVTRGSSLHDLFSLAEPASVYGQLGARMQTVSSADEGLQGALESGVAFIREKSLLTFKMAQTHSRLGQCLLQLAKQEFFSVGFGLGLSKGSRYLRAFDAALELMIENGFVARWQSMYWPRASQFTSCAEQDQTQADEGQPLSMKHFLSIYLVSSTLMLAALLLIAYQHTLNLVRSHCCAALGKAA